MGRKNSKNIDDYIKGFPKDTQKLLKQLRVTIRKAAPKAEEAIKYGMPTFTLGKNLVFFAGYKNHIGFYPLPAMITAFKKELSRYKSAKGSVQFPLDEPIPTRLVTSIVKLRVKQVLSNQKMK